MTITVDIEPTNRCNAYCTFCPRDNMPHQGLMSREVFEQALARSVELRATERSLGRPGNFTMTFCGLGEPLLNHHTADFVRKATEAGFACAMSSNGALLDNCKTHDLLEAGLRRIAFNVGAVDEEYERVYRLPFPRTRDNILRFKELAGDTCDVTIMLVDYKDDPSHRKAMHGYWRERGIAAFVNPGLINRGARWSLTTCSMKSTPRLPKLERFSKTLALRPCAPRRSLSSSSGMTVSTISTILTGRRKFPSGASSMSHSLTSWRRNSRTSALANPCAKRAVLIR